MRSLLSVAIIFSLASPLLPKDASALLFGKPAEAVTTADARRELAAAGTANQLLLSEFLRMDDTAWRVESFQVSFLPGGDAAVKRDIIGPFQVNSQEGQSGAPDYMPVRIVQFLRDAEASHGTLFVEDIRVRLPDASVRKMNSIMLRLQ